MHHRNLPSIGELRQDSLALLRDWTRIESVAGEAAGLRRMAGAVAATLRDDLGAELISDIGTGEAPVVHARIDRGAAVTILLYNMYDVMPANPVGWSVPPFAGGIADLPGIGPCYVARGAENNKGPLAGMLVALGALLKADCLHANIEIVVEGQEESGSAALRHYLLDPSTLVRRSDAALFPSFCEYGGGPPRVYLGTKGIAHGRIRVADGPARAIHSSNAPWIVNPLWRLIGALSRLPDGWLGTCPLPADMQPVLAKLAAGFDLRRELAFRHTAGFSMAGDAAALLEAVLTTTSLNLASMTVEPPDGRAVIPCAAEARFDLRLPPGIDPATILAQLRATLAGGSAELLVDDSYPGQRFAATHPAVDALVRTYQEAGTAPQIWPWSIGAMPAYAMEAVASCFLIGGLGRGGNAHGVDEFVTLEGLDRFIGSMLAWLPAVARLCANSSTIGVHP